MKMQKSLFIAVLLLLKLSATGATPEKRVKSTIKEVTVYLSGAKLTNVANVALSSGNSEVIFDNLPIGVNPSSMQIRFKGGLGATLLSAKFRTHYEESASVDAKILKLMRDSLTDFQDRFKVFANERDVLNGEQNLLTQNLNRIGTGQYNNLTVKDLQDLTAYYRTRLTEIKKRIFDLDIEERRLREPQTEVQNRFNELSQKRGKTSGEIVLLVNAPTAQSVEISCLYLVTNASWTPQYDLRSDGIDKPLKLVYKAEIHQNCGLDWSDVKLQLSTANPNISNNRPILNPQYVDYQLFRQVYGEKRKSETNDRAMTYNMAQVAPAGKIANEETLSEVVITKDENFVNEQHDVAALFEVPLSQTIPTDGEEHIVRVQENDLKATYEYHAVPKLDLSVFLLAKVTDYGQYHLVAGNANIFYQDTYIGQSFIDPRSVGDTLLLSLGRDEAVSIKRCKPVDLKSEKKIFGDTKKEAFEYEITVKNNKRIPIPIEIIDQVPVSRQKDIEVEVNEKNLSGADYNPTFGKLLWRVTVEANSSRKIKFGYTVKSPKNQILSSVF